MFVHILKYCQYLACLMENIEGICAENCKVLTLASRNSLARIPTSFPQPNHTFMTKKYSAAALLLLGGLATSSAYAQDYSRVQNKTVSE
jgi:hypothetical protein